MINNIITKELIESAIAFYDLIYNIRKLTPFLMTMTQTPLTLEQEAQDEQTTPERLAELAQINDNLAYFVAQNVNASPETLTQLGESNNQAIREAVVENANTPTEVLIELGSDFPEALGENPILDLWLFETIHPLLSNIKCQRKIAENEKTPEHLLSILAKTSDQEVRRLIAENPNTSPSTFEALVPYLGEKVRERLVDNPQTSPEILTKLANSQKLMKSLSKSQFSSYESMESEQELAIKLASHPNTPSSVLDLLATRALPLVQYGYQHNSEFNYLDGGLVFSSSITNPIRSALVTNVNASVNVLGILAKDSNDWIRSKVAEHPNTSPSLLKVLATDAEKSVRSKVAENPKTPVSLLKILASDGEQIVRRGVINNPNTPANLLEVMKKFNHLF
ncbi:MAG: hypothetical protein AB4058_09360 [Microcystaceae cyanobacterium]